MTKAAASLRLALVCSGVLALGLGTPVQAAPLPCALAVQLDVQTYTDLSVQTVNELNLDDASLAYSSCQASALSAHLARSPRLKARIGALRELYRALRGLEGSLEYAHAGGGTLYKHAIPRSFPDIEATLRGLTALALSRSGAQTSGSRAASIQQSRQAFDRRLAALRGWQGKHPKASFEYGPEQYAADVGRYEQTGKRLMDLLGNRDDAATAAGYLPLQTALFLDDEQVP